MSVTVAPYSRLLFVSVLVCAAVVSFFMCSASPILTQVDNGVKRNILRSLYTPYNQNPPLHVALLPTESRVQTGTNSETKTSRNFREASSMINHQSNHLQVSYDQNNPHNKRSGTGITEVWRGHSEGGVRPASTIFTRQRLNGLEPRVNYQPINRNSYNYPPIIRKFSQKEAPSPFPLVFWPLENPQKPYSQAKNLKFYSSKACGNEKVLKYSHSFLRSPPNDEYWATLLPTPRGPYSGYRGTNELAAVGVQSTSSRIQSSKFPGSASQIASRAPSVSKSLDASVIKSNPSPEKLTSSITDFSQGMNSGSSSKTQRYKKAQSYLFKDSQASFHGRETIKKVASEGARMFSITPREQQTSAAQGYSWLSSNLRQFQQKEPTKEVQHAPNNVKLLYHNTSAAHYGVQTHNLSKYPPVTTISSTGQTPSQLSSYPALGKTLESFAPGNHAGSLYSNVPSSKKPVVGRPVNKSTSGSMQDYKHAQFTKSLYGFRGFENPMRRTVEPPILSSNDGNSFQRYSFDQGKAYKFKTANVYSSLSKYSFGLRGASTTTTPPDKPERTPTHSSSPSPMILYKTQATTVSIPVSFSSGFKEVRSESNTHMDTNQNHRRFRISKKIYGLKGFGSRPLEGAGALVREPDKSATFQQDFEGFELRSSQIWQPKSSRIHRWYDQTVEAEEGTSKSLTQSQNKPQREDFKSLLKAAGSVESVEPSRFSPDKYKNHKTYAFPGFQPVQNRNGNANGNIRRKYTEQNPTTGSPTHKVSSAYLTPAGGLAVESSLKPEPGTVNKGNPVAMKARLLNISTSSIVRGRRVKGKRRKKLNESISLSNNTTNVTIVRLSKCPISVTYTDILGSASFSSVRVTTQAPTTMTDKDYFLNTAATTKQEKEAEQGNWENASRSPESNAEDDAEDFSSLEEKRQSVESEEADSGMETSGAFLDGEESRNRHFSNVLSPDITKSQARSEDLSEQDYLRKSTGNIFFKSMKLPPSDKW